MTVASSTGLLLETNHPDFPLPEVDSGRTVRLGGLPANSGGSLITRCFVMEDPMGFHARPAALFAKTAQQHGATILVSKKGGCCVNGKSIMGLLTLEILRGQELVVTADGADAAEAVSAIERLFADAFGQQKPDALSERGWSVANGVGGDRGICSAQGL